MEHMKPHPVWAADSFKRAHMLGKVIPRPVNLRDGCRLAELVIAPGLVIDVNHVGRVVAHRANDGGLGRAAGGGIDDLEPLDNGGGAPDGEVSGVGLVAVGSGEVDLAAGAVAGDGHVAGGGIDGDALKVADAPHNAGGVGQDAVVRIHSDAVGSGHRDGAGNAEVGGLRDIQGGSRAAYLHFGDHHSVGLGEVAGEKQLGVADAGDFVALRGHDAGGQRISEGLAGFGGQGDLGIVELAGLGCAGDGRTGGGSAFIPLHLAGVAGGGADIDRGVQRLALDRRINRSGHAGDGGFGNGDGSRGFIQSIGGIIKCSACCVRNSHMGYIKITAATSAGFDLKGCLY